MNAKPTRGTIVFASDLHLDHLVSDRIDCFERFLFESLPRMGCDKLFLVGDIFNIWYRDPQLAQRYGDRILAMLNRYVAEVGPMEYIVGNRDFALSFVDLDLSFPIHLEGIWRTLGDRKFFICHGDNLLKKDHGYHLLHGTIRQPFPMRMFHSLGTANKERIVNMLINLTHEVKRKKAFWKTEPFWPYLEDLVDEGMDVCIQGHKHDRTYRRLDGQKRIGRHFVLPRWFDHACGLKYNTASDRFHFFDLWETDD
ncbi:MAG: hypothetical protein H6752_16300 [Candidatus Omnitrophica bacterium]|nr:hypothetical protein [Candidatus Omnitrophota bacterium]